MSIYASAVKRPVTTILIFVITMILRALLTDAAPG